MKKAVLIISLFLLSLSSFGQETVGQDVPGQEPFEQKHYAEPLVYGVSSLIPGLGQFLLGEPKKGGTILLTGIGSTAVWFAGMSMVASNSTDSSAIYRIGYNLMIAGAVVWITTEYYSVTDALTTAKRKRGEIALAPTMLPIRTASGVSSAAGLSLALRF